MNLTVHFRETRQVDKFLTTEEPSRNAIGTLESFTDGCGHGFLLQCAVCYPEQTDRSEAFRGGKGATP